MSLPTTTEAAANERFSPVGRAAIGPGGVAELPEV
jgi:hypothetical protein